MRYLKQREEFIKNNKFSNYSLIKEDSGPLANEIPWGDSLLGRLINSVIRKAEIGMNLVRIDSVIDRLKGEFDKLIADSVVKTLDKKDAILIFKIKISTLLGKLKEAVDKGEDVEIIKSITKDLIKDVEGYVATSPEGDDAKKDILSKLNEFLKSLDTKKEGKPTEKGLITIHSKLVENFTSVYNILCHYHKMKVETGNVQKKSMEKEKASKKFGEAGKKVPTRDLIKKESILNEQTESTDANLLKSIKPLYDYSNKKYFNFPEDEGQRKSEFLNIIGNNQNKSPLVKIYTIIRKKLGVNESLVQFLTRPEDIANFVFTIYQTTKTKEAGDFAGIGDMMKTEIAKFNSTMKEILSFKSAPKENNAPVEPKTESILYKYSQFIKEAEETPVKEESPKKEEPKKEEGDESIKEIFYKIFSTDYLNKWVITEETAKRLEIEMDKANVSKSIVINGIDPIMEIVKIFNRAWKLHTVANIPSGRTGEKVSSRTKRDYYYMGTGNEPKGADAGGAGPWRIRTIYDKWESDVQDIMKNSKYQVIFNKDTTIKVGEADTRINVDKERKEGGGRALLKFMNSMLDGDDLYRKGAQAAFINQYFGIQVDDESLGFKGDKTIIDKTTEGLKETTKYSFKKVESLPDGTLLKEGDIRKFFSIKYNDGKKNTKYFFIDKIEGDNVFVKFSPSFHQFKQYLKKKGGVDLSKDIVVLEKDTTKNDYPIYYGRFSSSILPIKGGKTIKISGFNITDYIKSKLTKKETGKATEPKKEEITITGIDEISVLVDSNDTPFRLDDNLASKGDGLDAPTKECRDIYTNLK